MFGCRHLLPKRATPAWRMLVCLAIVALLGRAAIPAGYMPGASPAHGGKVALALCSGSGAVFDVLLDVSGKPDHSGHAYTGLDCPFGVMASQAAMPAPPPQAGRMPPAAPHAATPATRRALPPLPPLGPPLGSRAPPLRLV